MLQKVFSKIKYENVLLAVSILVVALSSIYIGRKEAIFNSLIGDTVIFNNLFLDGFKSADIYILSEHTFLIKYPLFILENLIGFTIQVHIIFSIFAILAMNLGMCALIYYYSNKNKVLSSMLILILSNITLFYMMQNYYWGYSALAIRNFEIPLLFFVVTALFKQNNISIKTIFLVSLLVILCLSDKLIFAFVLGAGLLYFLIELILNRKLKSISKIIKADRMFYLPVVVGLILVLAIETVVKASGLVLLTASIPKHTTESITTLIEAAPKFMSGIINLFGANIFNKTLLDALPNFINLVFLLVGICITIFLVKKYSTLKDKAVKFMILMLATNLLVFFLLWGTAIDRYLAFVPFMLLVFVAYTLKDVRFYLPKKLLTQVIVIALVFISFAVMLMHSRQQHSAMKIENYNQLASPLTKTKDISDILHDNNVDLVVGNYWLIHTSKFWYDQKFHDRLNIVSVMPLSEDSVAPVQFLSRKSWLTNPVDDNKNVAYAIRDFDYGKDVDIDSAAIKTFGNYTKKLYYSEAGIHLYIYNYDIRTKLSKD